MAKFIVFETYRIEHEVEADTADEAVEKVNDKDYEYTIETSYDYRPYESPNCKYISQSTYVLNLDTNETTE